MAQRPRKRRAPFGGFSARRGFGKSPKLTLNQRFRAMTQRKRAMRALANKRFGGFLGIEYKFLDTAWNNVTIPVSTDGSSGEMQPSSGCTGAISVPAQGDGESNRDGRKYTIKSVFVSGVVNTNSISDANDASDIAGYYFALVLDTQANGATIVSENVFVNPSTVGGAMLPQPLRNLQYSKRFKILDSIYVPNTGTYGVTDGASTASLSPMNQVAMKLSWRGNIVCDSSGTTADVASATDNAIHLIAYGGSSSQNPGFVGKARVRFVG
jgi:hypothetical protein